MPGPQLQDETLRDGLQDPSVVHPEIEEKLEVLTLMDELGIDGADLGLPAAGPRTLEHSSRLVAELETAGMNIKPSFAGRTLRGDIDAIVEISQRTGVRLEADLFLGASAVRRYAEGWTLGSLLKITEDSVAYAVEQGLEVMFVTEDAIRTSPEILSRLYRTALECGATRICLTDTVGHATPWGVRSLVGFAREVVRQSGYSAALDWHGHCDRGLSVANSLAAAEAGVDRIHGTALGIGERVGNTPMECL